MGTGGETRTPLTDCPAEAWTGLPLGVPVVLTVGNAFWLAAGDVEPSPVAGEPQALIVSPTAASKTKAADSNQLTAWGITARPKLSFAG